MLTHAPASVVPRCVQRVNRRAAIPPAATEHTSPAIAGGLSALWEALSTRATNSSAAASDNKLIINRRVLRGELPRGNNPMLSTKTAPPVNPADVRPNPIRSASMLHRTTPIMTALVAARVTKNAPVRRKSDARGCSGLTIDSSSSLRRSELLLTRETQAYDISLISCNQARRIAARTGPAHALRLTKRRQRCFTSS